MLAYGVCCMKCNSRDGNGWGDVQGRDVQGGDKIGRDVQGDDKIGRDVQGGDKI